MKIMTKKEFKQRWESNDDGGGITFEDLAECAEQWGLCSTPRTKPMSLVRYLVLSTAKVKDAENYNPNSECYEN